MGVNRISMGTSSISAGEWVTEIIEVDQGPRRPPITVTIRRHRTT